ncbi:hypothetical protein VIGAN_09147900 [Vigna angularis var. angularis]|uniref:Uncharacterized protein n=1 Tax=Vigna angularis var. angularis TaxID=157739 RepID=A0A0S3SYJ6_PHAAN|nr:hypothetical protein VIGAN_09147900 [Vigna angularis var. angularis]
MRTSAYNTAQYLSCYSATPVLLLCYASATQSKKSSSLLPQFVGKPLQAEHINHQIWVCAPDLYASPTNLEVFRRRISPEDLQPTVKICVDGLDSSLVAVKLSATAKLRLLAKNRADAGVAVPSLVPLLRCSDPWTQEHAVTALSQEDLQPTVKICIDGLRQNNQICVHGSEVAGGASGGGRERDGGQGKRWWCVNGGGGDSGGGGGQIRVFLMLIVAALGFAFGFSRVLHQ